MKSSTVKLIVTVLAVIFTGPYCTLAEEEETFSASLDVGAFSKYVWRGWQYSEDSVVIQPSLTAAYKWFSINLWENIDTDNKITDDPEYNETDVTVSYDTSIGDYDFGIGYVYYNIDDADDCEEFFASICVSKCPVLPTLTIYREVADAQGWYLNLGISHSFPVMGVITLDLAGSAGYYYSDDNDFVEVDNHLNPTDKRYKSLHDGLISLGLTIPINNYLTLIPMMAYSFPLVDNADDLITYDNREAGLECDSSYFFGGATLSISF
ncbi:conserved exported hypothetical protein [uncultured Desulfobacterium sp.]|uniref:Uncharacterized protein n=1 Tax=uncultured Desulfobacterium sp. TaxID=201089 RepID=A0A445MQM5_9BACT|nr:conserved exported hypothetical protein [uncultured Desulfobacterium sp.]